MRPETTRTLIDNMLSNLKILAFFSYILFFGSLFLVGITQFAVLGIFIGLGGVVLIGMRMYNIASLVTSDPEISERVSFTLR